MKFCCKDVGSLHSGHRNVSVIKMWLSSGWWAEGCRSQVKINKPKHN